MAKQSGLGDNLYVSGYDFSGDTQQINKIAGGPRNPLDFTPISKSAMERQGGKRDGDIDWTSFFNDASVAPVGAHNRLSLLPTTDQLVTYYRGTALGGSCASLVSKQVNYDGNRGDDGS